MTDAVPPSERTSDQPFRLLAEHASDIVARTSLLGVVEWISPSVESMLGWTADELVGRPVLALVAPHDHGVSKVLQDAVLRGGTATADVRLVNRSGGWRWMSARVGPLRLDDGRVVGRVVSLRDANEHHRAQEALRQREAQFRMLAENSSDVVASLDNAGVMRWVSPSLTEQLGWLPEELVGRNNDHLLHLDDMPVVIAAQHAILRGEHGSFEARFLTRRGQYVWMSVAGRPVSDAVDNIVGRIEGWRNVDTEHRVRDQLRASEERLRFLMEHASDVLVHEVEGVVEFVSPAVTRMLGWQPDDFLGKLATDYWHPDDRAAAARLRDDANHGAGGRMVLRLRHIDGTHRWVEIVAGPAPQADGRAGAVGVLRDVTERVQAEMQSDKARERDRVIAELSSDVYALFSPEGAIEWITGATVDLLGAEAADLLGMNGGDLFVLDDPVAATDARDRLLRGEHLSGLVRIRRLDGDVRWIDRRSRALFDEDGTLMHFATAWRDAQNDVELHETLAASERAAQEASLAKTTFLSRMSHELRTPLNAVLGFAQLLDMDDLDDGQHAAVAQILTGGRHLLDLINEVLDIARIEAGKMSMSPEVVMASDVIKEVLDLVRPQALRAGVTLATLDATRCRVPIFVDRQRTVQILLNLLTNGIKYNRSGGSVRVGCRQETEHEVIIDVVDDGVGIAVSDLSRLFEPFDRLGAESTDVEGTGIGLALSRGLAEMMHGRLEVRSEPGEGSTFSVVLPRAAAALEQSAAEVQHQAPALDDGRATVVLHVEDNPANRLLMRSVVARRDGVMLREAASGTDAIEMALADPPDLVLLDLHLPDMRGQDVLCRLRSEVRTAAVPVVVISADAAPSVRAEAAALGADEFLAKPVDIAALLRWIDRPSHPNGLT